MAQDAPAEALPCPYNKGTQDKRPMIYPTTETRPFFVEQAKSGRWNVWVFQRELEGGHKYAVKQTLKYPDAAYDWGLNYINNVVR